MGLYVNVIALQMIVPVQNEARRINTHMRFEIPMVSYHNTKNGQLGQKTEFACSRHIHLLDLTSCTFFTDYKLSLMNYCLLAVDAPPVLVTVSPWQCRTTDMQVP